MLTIIPGILDTTQLKQVRALLNESQFVDGRLSAGQDARRVKNNQELEANSRHMERLNQLVMGTLVQHPVYQAAALPTRIATPYYARYTAGMSYGDHVDDPIMGPPGSQYRSDISVTLFLNDADQYDGGELMIRTSYGYQRVKLNAGDTVLYPSSSLHRVNEVASGERLVAVSWIQSMVRDPQQRELLFQLYQSRETLRKDLPDAEVTSRIDQAYVNLVRMWSEI